MTKRIILNNPPFTPESNQVIYMEWQTNEGINAFIRKNYEWLRELFLSIGLQFCYLPILGKEVIRYNAPHLTDEECEMILASLPSLQDCVVKDDDVHGPVLVFFPAQENGDVNVFNYHCIEIENKWYKPNKKVFKKLAEDIESAKSELKKSVASEPAVRYGDSNIRFSLREKESRIEEEYGEDDDVLSTTIETNENRSTVRRRSPNIRFSIGSRRKEADEVFDEQAKVLVKEIQERINALRGCGVNTMFLHDIIDKEEKLSHLVITKDNRIILPDYDNMEIEMAALPKAVFLLFLKHPEGIRFKDLPEYYDELLNIYLSLNPMGSRQRQENSISSLTNPLGNSINEKCARVREAFVSKFDDRLAQNYYITGKKGEPKRITLDKKLIVWEQ